MTTIFEHTNHELNDLSLKEYFKLLIDTVPNVCNVEDLTHFFTDEPYSETKPYLIRRKLNPKDKRFKNIELVYDDRNKVSAIVWDINITLTQLKDIFGEPLINNEPISNSTSFAFPSTNKNISIIKTRHRKWLTWEQEKNTFEYLNSNNQKVELVDPDFSFIQIDLTKN
ncbi:MAG: hypothetical protein ACK46O_00640 [Flavobacteriia bacterium]|jgi:hypothetical protein